MTNRQHRATLWLLLRLGVEMLEGVRYVAVTSERAETAGGNCTCASPFAHETSVR
jgi:hypothetical protein